MLVRFTVGRGALTIVLAVSTAAYAEEPEIRTDAQLAGPIDRATLVHAAIGRSPAVRAAAQRARATMMEADAQGRLPPPQAMVQVWQVPLARPYAVNDAQMVMIGISQEFPPPGSRGARQAARVEQARAEEAMASDRARQVVKDAEHAFADYVEAAARHRVHLAHGQIGERILHTAEARHAAGGSLAEVAQADAELARALAEVATDAVRIEAARARINGLLARDPRAALGEPIEGEPLVPAWSVEAALARARESRSGLRVAQALYSANSQELRAAEREAVWPSFNVAGLYFVPTSPLPAHGYGINASMTLPWLWGAASARRAAREQELEAAKEHIVAERVEVDVEVATAEAATRGAARRLQIFQGRARPASRRAFDVAWTGYESARTDLLTVLTARRAVVDADEGVVMARAALDHALADLDAAVGAPVPRVPLTITDGGSHAR